MLHCRLGCVLEPNSHTEYSPTPLHLLLLQLPLLLPYFVLCTLYFVLCTLYFDEEEKMMPWGGSLDCLEESSGGGMRAELRKKVYLSLPIYNSCRHSPKNICSVCVCVCVRSAVFVVNAF